MKYPKSFEYIFYRIALFYAFFKDGTPRFSSIILFSVVQSMHILTIFFSLAFLFNISNIKIPGLIIAFLILVLNQLYFNKKTFNRIIEKWRNETIQDKKRRGLIVGMYVILSFILFFGVAIYLGSFPKK